MITASGVTPLAPAGNYTGFARPLLDPYCCFVGTDPIATFDNTPWSSTVNFVGGFLRRLVVVPQPGGVSSPLNGSGPTVGVAIDHRTAGTVRVYYVYTTDGVNAFASDPIDLTITGDAVPFVFGHPQGALVGSDAEPAIRVNFGTQRFFFDSAPRQLRNIVPGALSGTPLLPGLGANERALR